jgi:muramoyltetrapeptide carboxypeptidase
VLTGLVGTPWMPDLRGHLLAIEDIDERPYRLDRDLWQLHRSGALRGITGLIGGTFPAHLPEGYAGPTAATVLTAWADRLGIPALGGVPFGHEADPLTLALRRPSHLIVDDQPRLIQDPRP